MTFLTVLFLVAFLTMTFVSWRIQKDFNRLHANFQEMYQQALEARHDRHIAVEMLKEYAADYEARMVWDVIKDSPYSDHKMN